MRNIKLTETEWKYIKDALYYGSLELSDSWFPPYPSKEWLRKNTILKRAEYKFVTAKKEVA